MKQTLAGLELGGTKSIAVLASNGVIIDRLEVATTEPIGTLTALADRLGVWHGATPLAAIGIASFGPLTLDPADASFGCLLKTPKPGWSYTDVFGFFRRRVGVPTGIDTDVAGAALAEGAAGAALGCSDYVYLTVGTGVGAGVVANDRIVHGRLHPEVGHIQVRRRDGDLFGGVCPFHGDCLEGLVSGPALAARTSLRADQIDAGHPVWLDVAAELAQLMAMLILTLAPARIVIGGGVANRRPFLLPLIRAGTSRALQGYLATAADERLTAIIVAPGLGEDAGPRGALELAGRALAATE